MDTLNILRVCMVFKVHNLLATYTIYGTFSNSMNYFSVLADDTTLNLQSEINKQECLCCEVIMLDT